MANYTIDVTQGIKIGTSVSVDKTTGFYLEYAGLIILVLLSLLTIVLFPLFKHFLISWLEEQIKKRGWKTEWIVLIILLITLVFIFVLYKFGSISDIIKLVNS